VKKTILAFFIISILLSGCANSFKLGKRNLIRGDPVISDIGNTKTAVINNSVPIITIMRPEYQVDIYAFADGGEVHYVSVVIAGEIVSANVSDRVNERVQINNSGGSNKTNK
jgi:hypothetical protein